MRESSVIGELPVRWLLDALQRLNVPPTDIAAILECSEQDLGASDIIASVENYTRLFEWAATDLREPALGMHIAYETKPSEFGVFGYLLDNATTISEFFDLLDGYHAVFTDSFGLTSRRAEGLCIIHYEEEHVLGVENRQDIEFTTAALVRTISEKSDSRALPTYCKFTFSEPKDLHQHHRIFGKNLSFDQPENLIAFDSATLGYDVDGADPTLQAILRRQADLILNEASLEVNIAKAVSLMIASEHGAAVANAEMTADRLNLSVRSLHRRLALEGASFRNLRNEVVHNAARFALRSSSAPVNEIAGQLGYSETSAFDRAFKRREGLSPSKYRKTVRPA